MRLEPVPPPDPESREWSAVPCRVCGRVETMHRSARCHRCGDWLVTVDAASVMPGDWLLWGRWWWQIDGLARTTNTDGVDIVRFSLNNCKTMDLYPDAACILAKNLRPAGAVAA